jgi:hypothetical protein
VNATTQTEVSEKSQESLTNQGTNVKKSVNSRNSTKIVFQLILYIHRTSADKQLKDTSIDKLEAKMKQTSRKKDFLKAKERKSFFTKLFKDEEDETDSDVISLGSTDTEEDF